MCARRVCFTKLGVGSTFPLLFILFIFKITSYLKLEQIQNIFRRYSLSHFPTFYCADWYFINIRKFVLCVACYFFYFLTYHLPLFVPSFRKIMRCIYLLLNSSLPIFLLPLCKRLYANFCVMLEEFSRFFLKSSSSPNFPIVIAVSVS